MEGENCKCIETKMKNDMAIILEKYTTDKDNLIQILNETQEKFGYVPKLAQREISKYLNISMAEIYGVITFYSRFTLEPKGKYAASAVYLYPREVVPVFKQYIDEGNKIDAPGNFVAYLYKKMPFYAYPFVGEWHDVGTHESLARVNELYSNKKEEK